MAGTTLAPGTLLMAGLLTALTSAQGLLTSASKSGDGYAYDFATVPFLAEITKFLISYGLLRRQRAADPGSVRITRDLRTVALFIVPSIIYMVHNNVQVGGWAGAQTRAAGCWQGAGAGGRLVRWRGAGGQHVALVGAQQRAAGAGGRTCPAVWCSPLHGGCRVQLKRASGCWCTVRLLSPTPVGMNASLPAVFLPQVRGPGDVPDPGQPQNRDHRPAAAPGAQAVPQPPAGGWVGGWALHAPA